ncbi:MAG: NAD(P)H-binding protein, partial [Cyanobacteria bacterium P01_F01_bin.42]
MKVFVAGATGETGRRVVAQLLEQGIEVKALVRDRAKAEAMFPKELELVEGNLSSVDALKSAMQDCTVLVSATGARPSLNPTGPFSVDYVGTKN